MINDQPGWKSYADIIVFCEIGVVQEKHLELSELETRI